MNPPTGKNPLRLRPFYKGGLVFVVVGALVSFWLSPKRPDPPLTVKPKPRDRRVAVLIVESQPTIIDADELALAGQERYDNALGMVFCWCPPGEFSMGGGPKSVRGRYLDGEPVRVSIGRGFWMGKFEVTQDQWQKVMGRTLQEQRFMDPRQPRPLGDDSKRDHAGMGPDHPIYFASYLEAREFCDRLTHDEGRSGQLETGWVYSLPTVAQWEFACRAGTMASTAFGDRLGSPGQFRRDRPLQQCAHGPLSPSDEACRQLSCKRLGPPRYARKRLGVVPQCLQDAGRPPQ